MNLGEQLKNLRESKNMSREDLAKKMNVSRETVYKWENSECYPNSQNLLRLSEIHETTVVKLIKANFLTSQIEETVDKREENIFNILFYIGMAIIFFGFLLDLLFGLSIFFVILNILGTLIVCFPKK
ncbi:helix-turn-helix domain-containing protein [Priestia endophytica]|uniref:helix-turn-helix domain-containing protein n=1 Tax=Priestia endophytica TaxID=135735 RepID=UPI001558C402|nr:helix-turn-helix transcriptional regulator [Priestia endophytica]